MKNPKKIILLSLLVIAALAAGIWLFNNTGLDQNGLPKGKVSWEFISAREEAGLQYPGAEVFKKFGNGQVPEQSLTGLSVAHAGAVMTTSSTPAEVYAWYKSELTKREWVRDDGATARGGVSGELSHQTYSRHGNGAHSREAFVVRLWRPEAIAGTLGKDTPQGRTVFEYVYYIRSLDQIEAAKARGI